jgi:transcriptional regulator with XRE-family HTH domain
MQQITKSIQKTIRQRRKELNLSQVRLSELTGVSLPTIQNIERFGGNPTIEILSLIGHALGYELQWQPTHNHTTSTTDIILRPLLQGLARWQTLRPRDQDEIMGDLIALQTHYPSYFKKNLERRPKVKALLANASRSAEWGRWIKLARIACSRMSHIL